MSLQTCPGCQGPKPRHLVVCVRCWPRLNERTRHELSGLSRHMSPCRWRRKVQEFRRELARGVKLEEITL